MLAHSGALPPCSVSLCSHSGSRIDGRNKGMVHENEGIDIARVSGAEWSCVRCHVFFSGPSGLLDAHEHWGYMSRLEG